MNAAERVLLTDRGWPDAAVEAAICAEAGFELVEAPEGADEAALAALTAEVDPVGLLFCWAPVSAAVLRAAPRLKVATRLGVGLDNIDLHEAARRELTVTRVPDYCVEEVSDHVLALTLAWARGILDYDRDVRAGVWNAEPHPLRRVRELSIGVWGFGAIGRRVGEKFAALDCTVRFANRSRVPSSGAMTQVAVEELLATSDVLTLHLPGGPDTADLLDGPRLATMKPGSLLVNTGRGTLVAPEALAAALDAGRPGAAALDVLPSEPEVPAALRGRADVVITPHVAFNSATSLLELRTRAAKDLVRVLQGEAPLDPVELPTGEA